MQIKISLSEISVEKLDILSLKKGLKRSSVITLAIDELIKKEFKETGFSVYDFSGEEKDENKK